MKNFFDLLFSVILNQVHGDVTFYYRLQMSVISNLSTSDLS